MTKFLANVALLAASLALMLAQYWYTFGMWPKSWTAFALCSVGMLVIMALRTVVERE